MQELQEKQCTEALMQVALTEAKTMSVRLTEVIAFVQKKEHLAALGAFQGIQEQCRFLGTVLEVAARLPRK